jgi:hypothetical protein
MRGTLGFLFAADSGLEDGSDRWDKTGGVFIGVTHATCARR